jgi:hypothetical protein
VETVAHIRGIVENAYKFLVVNFEEKGIYGELESR